MSCPVDKGDAEECHAMPVKMDDVLAVLADVVNLIDDHARAAQQGLGTESWGHVWGRVESIADGIATRISVLRDRLAGLPGPDVQPRFPWFDVSEAIESDAEQAKAEDR